MISLIGKSFLRWKNDNCARLGAALSYYLVFALAPLLLLSISIAAFTFGESQLRVEMTDQLHQVLGQHSAAAIQLLMNLSNRPTANVVSSFVGIVILLIGASGVIVELKDAMNKVWRVTERGGGWRLFLKEKFISIILVLATGGLLLVSLLVSAGLSAAGKFMGEFLPLPEVSMQLISFFISFVVITGLFATLYKMLPSTYVAWNDVWYGAAIASFLFSVGKVLIGLYLGKTSLGSAHGAAGSLVILLIWIYYSAQIFYFGAEYSKLTAEKNARSPSLE